MKNEITPIAADSYQLGAIITHSWGYDQTNIDFYCVVEIKGEWIKILPMTKLYSQETSFMAYEVKPNEVRSNVKPARKKLRLSYDGKNFYIGFGNYTGAGIGQLWKGKPVTETKYA